MKEYLKKLGKTKFQAFLLVTIINLVSFIAYLTGNLKLNDQVQQWMPVINLLVQAIATAVYQIIEGSIDREAQKQNVYVMPGSAPVPSDGNTQAAAPAIGNTTDTNLSWADFKPIATFVNNELNAYMDHIDKGKLTDVARQAIARYKNIHDYLQSQDPLPPAQNGGGADAIQKSQ